MQPSTAHSLQGPTRIVKDKTTSDPTQCANIINAHWKAPISRLPPDVLGLIFQDVHHNENQTSRHPLSRSLLKLPYYKLQCPLALSHVSRSWYNLVHSSPLLWTTVDISPPWNLSLIDMFFARSKTCPIYLNIIAQFSRDDVDLSADIDRLCGTLVPHISRCCSIYIRTDDHSASLFDALRGHFRDMEAPLLQQFFLQGPLNTFDPHPIFTLGAPMLSFVHLSSYGINFCLPSTSLTSLHLETRYQVDLSRFISVISQCPLLETLAIYDDIPFFEVMKFTLPCLRSLQLYGNMGSVGEILLSISAPVLENLVLSPCGPGDLEPLHVTEGSGPRKFMALSSITLAPFYTFDCPAELLRLASECFPNVTDVTLIGNVPDVFVEALKTTDGDVFFPNMRSLALRDLCPRLTETLKALSDLISCRVSRGKPFRTIYLDKESMYGVSALQQCWLQVGIEVVELDKWSIIRQDSLFCDEEDNMFYLGDEF